DRCRALEQGALDIEGRSTGRARAARALGVRPHVGGGGPGRDAAAQLSTVETRRVAEREEIRSGGGERGPLVLVTEQQVVYRPKPLLPGGAQRDLRRGCGILVQARQGQVDVHKP